LLARPISTTRTVEDGAHGPDEDLDIEERTGPLLVGEFETYALIPVEVCSSRHLPKPSHAGT
jgi:hypothetical protein